MHHELLMGASATPARTIPKHTSIICLMSMRCWLIFFLKCKKHILFNLLLLLFPIYFLNFFCCCFCSHNTHHYLSFFGVIREAITEGRFEELRQNFIEKRRDHLLAASLSACELETPVRLR